MARGQAHSDAADAVAYTAEDWLVYGSNPEPNTREKMILISIEEIKKWGPADFNTNRVCDRLDLKTPMVNHYFGNRDGLMAEATFYSYQEWTRRKEVVFRQEKKNSKKRLVSLVEFDIEWSKHLGGMSLLLHYPFASLGAQSLVRQQHGVEMEKMFQYHLAMLAVCIRDIRAGKFTPADFDISNFPNLEFLKTPNVLFTAGHIAWMSHGVSIWASGQHISSEGLNRPDLTKLTVGMAMKDYLKLIVRVAEKDV